MNRILQSYKDMWTRLLDFKGRSTVAEYWCPFFINVFVTLLFLYIIPLPIIVIVYHIAILLPCISLAIRRLHDANRSGWNILWLYIPSIILLVYASAILFYTQKPEIVDLFLNWFTVMVVGYVVFLVYSIYLLTHHTFPKKNHYGEVQHLAAKTEKLEDEVLLEAPAGASVEGTLTFKTKAFLEKARNMKKKEEPSKIEETAKTEKLHTKEEAQIEIKKDEKEPDGSVVIRPKKRNVVKNKETVEAKLEEAISQEAKEEIIVMAQLKPSKKRPVKKATITEEEKIKDVDSSIKKEEESKKKIDSPSKKEKEQEIVKTITQKRAEVQQSSTMPKAIIMEEIKEKKTTAKIVHKPIKRKSIQPIEVPNVNVESIRTHSLDSIAKLVEQNMTKDNKEAPTVVANLKKQPIKRKRKEETEK